VKRTANDIRRTSRSAMSNSRHGPHAAQFTLSL